jgi:hypothetical protein
MEEVMKDLFTSGMSTILIVSGVIIMILAIVFKGVQIDTGPSLPGRRPLESILIFDFSIKNTSPAQYANEVLVFCL